jgi:cell division septation protein DedD
MGTYQNTRVVGNSMADDAMADTEITLGVGQLLGLFFGLVILCGLSLGTGYWLGRNSTKQALTGATAVAAAPGTAPSADGKPGAAQLASQVASPDGQPKAADCASGDNCQGQAVATGNAAAPGAAAPNASTSGASTANAPTSNASDLTFYKTVQQKDNAHPQLTPPEPVARTAPPAAADPRSTLGAGYLVQIAAVRNPDDAKLLSGALQKQQYPVIVTQPGDKLFHVQVGPYADIKEADAIRARLIGAGYNAFLKH